MDEATATQIVRLHNEVTGRLQGDAGALMQVVGRVRPELAAEQTKADPALAGAPCLGVASIDIGGGTTDLMVTTYLPGGGEAIVPRQEFREGFKVAGGDVLERVVSEVVLPAPRDALRAAGVPAPGAVLSLALGVLAGPAGESTRRAMRRLEERAERAGGRGSRVGAVEVSADTARVEPAIRSVFGPVLADPCEVVWAYDCDVLPLSGRPSRLRAVGDMVPMGTELPLQRLLRRR